MSDADLTTHHIEGIAAMNGQPFRVDLFSHITGNLWTGGNPIGKAPEEFQFIISLYPWEPYEIHPHQVVTQAQLFDHGQIPDEKLLHVLSDHVGYCMDVGKTLVHCQAGLNRSGLIAALALIKHNFLEPADAIKLLRERRCDMVLCNSTFEKWLLDL